MDKDAKVRVGKTPCDRCKCEPVARIEGDLVIGNKCSRTDELEKSAKSLSPSLGEAAIEFADKHKTR